MGATSYTDDQRKHAVALADEVGPAEASRRTGIPRRTISAWREPAQADVEKTQAARAAGNERVQRQWADFREQEALSAGAAANRLRQKIVESAERNDASMTRSAAVAYGILIDKAELLSGQATQRIEHWAESEADRDLRKLVAEMEAQVRRS